MKTRVAVLLAAYNGKKWIEEQIKSIVNQQNVNVMIFISIDPSADGTKEFLEMKYSSNNQVIILEDVGHFGGAAKNFFRLIRDVDFTSYDFIAFADQDDIWYEGKFSRAIQQLQERQCDGYSSNVLAFWEDGREKLIVKSQPQCHYDYLFEAAGPGCTYVMTKTLASEIKSSIAQNWDAINDLWLHDWFCYAYSRANNFKWTIDDRPSMRYRQHTQNQVGVNQGWKAFLHRVKKVIFGNAIEQSHQIAALVGMKNDIFVKQWEDQDRMSFLRLAFHAHECRRKKKEKLLFFIACMVMAITGKEKKKKVNRLNRYKDI